VSPEQAERAILRWCRVRGHECEHCCVQSWCDPFAKLRAYVSVRESETDGTPRWAVRVDGDKLSLAFPSGPGCGVILHTPGTYAQAWALGADLARALERRGADGRRA
jgi:hypothetical protein